MAVITMSHITPPEIAHNILGDFAAVYHFTQNKAFMWSPAKMTIIHPPLLSLSDTWSLLHEISHAELNHHDYKLDVELVGLEAAAWEYARATLAPRYTLVIDDDFIQNHLDTYRQWLHKRSSCPQCGQNGLQTQNTYRCINCRCSWRANGARMCALKRTKVA